MKNDVRSVGKDDPFLLRWPACRRIPPRRRCRLRIEREKPLRFDDDNRLARRERLDGTIDKIERNPFAQPQSGQKDNFFRGVR